MLERGLVGTGDLLLAVRDEVNVHWSGKHRAPLTGQGVVDRIITDLGVMDVTPEGLKLVELAPGVSFEQIQSKTGVTLLR